jgi:hypothetical protein
MALKIISNSTWAINSTFKTNIFDFPLYTTVCLNDAGLGMPVFWMVCNKDKGASHESMALQLTIEKVFERVESTRPNVLIIDKNLSKFNAFSSVINHDPWCLENDKQTRGLFLTCTFHSKKS